MPAIQPALLRQQAALLAEHYDDPPAYVRSLHYLLDFYADRSRYPSRAGKPSPAFNSYKVRAPVLRMMHQELIPLVAQEPEAGLALCDALWAENVLEFRQLAAMLLGQFPLPLSEEVTRRVDQWLTPDLDFFLIEYIIEHALYRLRTDQPNAVILLIEKWLETSDPFHQQLGLRLLLQMTKLPDFQNVPAFYRLIQPLTLKVPAILRPDLLDVIASLAQRYPQETAFFLQQSLRLPNSIDTAWLIRQSYLQFPPVLQQSLRQAERNAGSDLSLA